MMVPENIVLQELVLQELVLQELVLQELVEYGIWNMESNFGIGGSRLEQECAQAMQ
jgi:hypothetical protein